MRHKITISLDVEDGYLTDTLRMIADEVEDACYGDDISSLNTLNAKVKIDGWKEYYHVLNS